MPIVTTAWKTFRDLVQRHTWIFILGGVAIRVMYFLYILFFQINPNQWGDIKLNIGDGKLIWENLQLGRGFFYEAKFPFLGGVYVLLVYLAGSWLPIEQAYFWFAFSQMVMECAIIFAFYFVVKAWTKDIHYAKLAVILWLCNPFWLIVEVIDLDRIGYHPTDYLFLFFVLIAMYFHTREGGKKWCYIFLGLTVSIKIFTLPLIAILAANFIINPAQKETRESLIKINWPEIKQLILYMGIPIFLTFFLPMLLDLQNLESFFGYRDCSIFGGRLTLWMRLIPPLIASSIFLLQLIRKPGSRDFWTSFNWSVTIGGIFWIVSQPYLRYLIYPLPVGLARRKEKKVLIWGLIGIITAVFFWIFGIGEGELFILPGGSACWGT